MAAFPDPENFRPFVEKNFGDVATFAWSVLGGGLEAEDVAQEAFVIVYRSRGRLHPERSARAYLYRIAFRLCLSRLRRQKRRAALALLAVPLVPSAVPPPSDPLDAWFRSLSKRQRAIAHLYFSEDRDAGEIAQALGIQPVTVRVQLARIRARLRARTDEAPLTGGVRMFPDEEEIRRSLIRRAIRPGGEAWPEIRRRLDASSPPRARRRLALAGVLVVLLAATLWLRQSAQPPSTGSVAGFQVSRVESRGKPSAALILQPDTNTLVVVVPD